MHHTYERALGGGATCSHVGHDGVVTSFGAIDRERLVRFHASSTCGALTHNLGIVDAAENETPSVTRPAPTTQQRPAQHPTRVCDE
jgi:hypothetical protein